MKENRSAQGQGMLQWRRLNRWLLCAILAAVAGGCATRVPNVPLAKRDPQSGYYFHTKQRTNNSDEILFILMFSGGGTRAASFSYGVLQALRDIEIPDGAGGRRHLLGEVDAISSVSGGSVTAAAYGLYGEEIFPMLEDAFLTRNIQGGLAARVLNPFRWPRLWSGKYGRSDMAAEYYDNILFRNATFADLHRGPGPYVVINSTDVSTGSRFEFTQPQFDLMCSDLSAFPVSKAVAASSAVPGLLTPVTVNNYAGSCDCEPPGWITRKYGPTDGRGQLRATELKGLLDSTNKPFVHVVDGGVSDNLGIRAVIDNLHAMRQQPELLGGISPRNVRTVVCISVNAFAKQPKEWDKRERPPGSLTAAAASAGITMDRYSIDTLMLAREEFQILQRELSPNGDGNVKFYPIHLSFTQFREPKQKNFFLGMPTSFFLPATAVKELENAGRQLLDESETFQRLLKDLGATRKNAPVTPQTGSE
jgi:NTE family protein